MWEADGVQPLKLKKLCFTGCTVNASAGEIAEPKLKHGATRVGLLVHTQPPENLRFLSWMNLDELDVSGNTRISSATLKYACSRQSHRNFVLRAVGCDWNNQHLEAISQLHLQHLDISSNDAIGEVGLARFVESIAERQGSDRCSKRFKLITKDLGSQTPITVNVVRALSMCWLEELDLTCCEHDYGADGSMLMAKALRSPQWANLKRLVPFVTAGSEPVGMLSLAYAALTHAPMDEFRIHLQDQDTKIKLSMCVCSRRSQESTEDIGALLEHRRGEIEAVPLQTVLYDHMVFDLAGKPSQLDPVDSVPVIPFQRKTPSSVLSADAQSLCRRFDPSLDAGCERDDSRGSEAGVPISTFPREHTADMCAMLKTDECGLPLLHSMGAMKRAGGCRWRASQSGRIRWSSR